MKTKLPEKIETTPQAQKFLKELYDNREAFHPDDSAFYVDWTCEEPSEEEKIQLNKLMGEVCDIEGFDPYQYLNDLMLCENDVVLFNPGPGEENILYRITNYNEITRRCYIEPVHWEGEMKPQELVSIDELSIAY